MAFTKSDHQSNELLFTAFNQNSTSLAIGGQHGYKMYSLDSVDKLEPVHCDDSVKDVNVVERLFSSSLVAMVSLNSPRKVKLCHMKKGRDIWESSYPNTILAVKMNRSRIVVVLENAIYILSSSGMKSLHTIRDTPSNLKGICALSCTSENSLLAYPGSQHIGEVQIFDATNLKAVTTFQAHNNPLAAIAFSRDASLIATASDKGTVIRVFSVQDGKKLHEFRRGVKRCVTICSLAFSGDSTFLAASSNTETVHVFKLEENSPANQPPPNVRSNSAKTEMSWMDYFSKVLASSSTYLPVPAQVSDMLTQDRAFATVKLPSSSKRNICTLAVIQKLLRVVVASVDGYLYIYNLDPEDGGECTLIRQHRLDVQPGFMNNTPSIDIPASYAEATRVKRIKNRTESTGSSASGSSDSSSSYRQYLNNAILQCPSDDSVDPLPLDDVKEFPPVAVSAK